MRPLKYFIFNIFLHIFKHFLSRFLQNRASLSVCFLVWVPVHEKVTAARLASVITVRRCVHLWRRTNVASLFASIFNVLHASPLVPMGVIADLIEFAWLLWHHGSVRLTHSLLIISFVLIIIFYFSFGSCFQICSSNMEEFKKCREVFITDMKDKQSAFVLSDSMLLSEKLLRYFKKIILSVIWIQLIIQAGEWV